MRKIFFLSIFVLAAVTWATVKIPASQLQIVGNGDGSQSGIDIQSGDSINIQQKNSVDVINDVNASANTGGNSVSGNDGEGQIITGNATTEVDIKNLFNNNSADVPCCATSTPTPKAGLKKNITPTPTSFKSTPAPSVGNGDGGNGDGVNGAGPGPVGGAQVLGLAATAGPVYGIEYMFYGGGLLCFRLAGLKFRKP